MSTDANTGRAACTSLCRPPRHRHHSPDLDATGLPCSCGARRWALSYGGVLPVTMSCLACGQGVGLERLLEARRRSMGGE